MDDNRVVLFEERGVKLFGIVIDAESVNAVRVIGKRCCVGVVRIIGSSIDRCDNNDRHLGYRLDRYARRNRGTNCLADHLVGLVVELLHRFISTGDGRETAPWL